MRPILSVATAAGLSVPAVSAAEANCGCSRVIPAAGSYEFGAGASRVQISYIDGNDTACPTKLSAVIVPPPPGQSAFSSATLTCTGEGRFQGEDKIAFLPGDHGTWKIEAPEAAVKPSLSLASEGASPATEFKLTLVPPATIKATPAAQSYDRVFTATLEGDGRAADCMCVEVRQNIDTYDDAIALFGDTGLMRQALANGNAVDPEFACVGGAIPNTDPAGTYSAPAVDFLTVPRQGCKATAPADSLNDVIRNRVRKAQNVGPGSPVGSTAAGTDPVTCDIDFKKGKFCDSQALINAIVVHEKMHEVQCLKMNTSSSLKQLTRDLVASLKNHPAYRNDDPSWITPSFLFFNNPVNTGRFEVAAYRESRRVLQEFHDKYCG